MRIGVRRRAKIVAELEVVGQTTRYIDTLDVTGNVAARPLGTENEVQTVYIQPEDDDGTVEW